MCFPFGVHTIGSITTDFTRLIDSPGQDTVDLCLFGFQSLFFRHPLDYGFNFYAFNPLGINYGVGDPFFQSWSWGLFPWRSPIPFGWVGYSNWNNWNAYSMRGNNFVSYNRGSGNIVDYTNRRNYPISSSDNRSSIGESNYNRGVNKRT